MPHVAGDGRWRPRGSEVRARRHQVCVAFDAKQFSILNVNAEITPLARNIRERALQIHVPDRLDHAVAREIEEVGRQLKTWLSGPVDTGPMQIGWLLHRLSTLISKLTITPAPTTPTGKIMPAVGWPFFNDAVSGPTRPRNSFKVLVRFSDAELSIIAGLAADTGMTVPKFLRAVGIHSNMHSRNDSNAETMGVKVMGLLAVYLSGKTGMRDWVCNQRPASGANAVKSAAIREQFREVLHRSSGGASFHARKIEADGRWHQWG